MGQETWGKMFLPARRTVCVGGTVMASSDACEAAAIVVVVVAAAVVAVSLMKGKS